jgi:hypothetical protein
MLKKLLTTFLLMINALSYAESWFTGPLMALPARTIPRGHINLQLFNYGFINNAIYNHEWQSVKTAPYTQLILSPQLYYGLTDQIDVEWNPSYINNRTQGKESQGLGDTAITLGFQVLKQSEFIKQPDLRVTIEEILPSGRYDQLSTEDKATDALGIGNYQTEFGLNFQYLSHLTETHDFNTMVSLYYTYAGAVNIRGLSAYGGTPFVDGQIKPGNAFAIDLAGELSLTRNWVAVMEGYYQYAQASSFKNARHSFLSHLSPERRLNLNKPRSFFPSKQNIGGLYDDKFPIGNGIIDSVLLAPAIEYNFTDSYGVIVGSIFSLVGKNVPVLSSLVVSFNANW